MQPKYEGVLCQMACETCPPYSLGFGLFIYCAADMCLACPNVKDMSFLLGRGQQPAYSESTSEVN